MQASRCTNTSLTHTRYSTSKGSFPKPEGIWFECRVTATRQRDLNYFSKQAEAGLIRLPGRNRITRMYEQELVTGPFEDARQVPWQLRKPEDRESTIVIEGTSSPYWFSDLRKAGALPPGIDREPPVREAQ